MKTRIVLLLGIILSSTARAQPVNTSIGIRLSPDGGGAIAKFFFDQHLAIEAQLNMGGIFALEGESMTATGLIEYHIPLPAPSWRIYFGGGGHIGYWTNNLSDGYTHNDFILGIDGIGGIGYNFPKLPLGISADYKPAINFVSYVDFFPHNIFGIACRYYIPGKKKKK